jgi:arylsulfatase A-like enzyme
VALGVFDWVASGVERVPVNLLGVILLGGIFGGLLAGVSAALLNKRGLAFGLVVFGGCALHAASTYTKSIGPLASGVGSILAAISLMLLAGAAAVLSGRTLARQGGILWPGVVLASIPGASLIWSGVPHTPLYLGLTCALPLVAALVWRLEPPRWGGAVAFAASVAALLAPSAFIVRASERRLLDGANAPAPRGPPDIAVVVLDTLRLDEAFPEDPAAAPPTLARLAREGVRFDQAVSSAGWTLPSISSLLTSLHPSQHGAVTKEHRLPQDVDTLAEHLHAAGYATAAFTGGGFLSRPFGFDQGFELFDQFGEYGFLQFPRHAPLMWRLMTNRWSPAGFLLRQIEPQYVGFRALRERALAWVERRDPQRPYFLFVHTYQVHDYFNHQPETDAGVLDGSGRPLATIDPSLLNSTPQEQLDGYRAVYRHRIQVVDRELDRLLASLEANAGPGGLVVVVTSDHGEGFDAQRGRVHHGARLHDDLLRVPLLVWAPGRLPAGRVVEAQVRLLDVLPTVLDLADLDTPPAIAGRSLLPLVRAEEDEPRVAWSEDEILGLQVSLRTPSMKVVECEPCPGQGEWTIRLDRDPEEDRRLGMYLPADLSALWNERKTLLWPREREESQADAATLENLERLGY